MNPKVSVVIVPYDNPQFFERSFNSILENTDYENFEVVVAHNPCEDENKNKAIKGICTPLNYPTHTKIHYMRLRTNQLHAIASQTGAMFVTDAKYVVLCNDDIFIPSPQLQWLSKMVNFIGAQDSVATVTPSLYYPNEKCYWIGKQDPKQPMHDFLHVPRGDAQLPTKRITTCYNNMAVCLTRTRLLKEFPLTEGPPHYGSDSGFANRIHDKYPDMEHWVLPDIKIYHWNIFASRENYGKDQATNG